MIPALCRTLIPHCIHDDPYTWFTIWSEKEAELHEVMSNLVFARMFRYDEPFNQLLAQLRAVLS